MLSVRHERDYSEHMSQVLQVLKAISDSAYRFMETSAEYVFQLSDIQGDMTSYNITVMKSVSKVGGQFPRERLHTE
jgi:hypothetical protein